MTLVKTILVAKIKVIFLCYCVHLHSIEAKHLIKVTIFNEEMRSLARVMCIIYFENNF